MVIVEVLTPTTFVGSQTDVQMVTLDSPDVFYSEQLVTIPALRWTSIFFETFEDASDHLASWIKAGLRVDGVHLINPNTSQDCGALKASKPRPVSLGEDKFGQVSAYAYKRGNRKDSEWNTKQYA